MYRKRFIIQIKRMEPDVVIKADGMATVFLVGVFKMFIKTVFFFTTLLAIAANGNMQPTITETKPASSIGILNLSHFVPKMLSEIRLSAAEKAKIAPATVTFAA